MTVSPEVQVPDYARAYGFLRTLVAIEVEAGHMDPSCHDNLTKALDEAATYVNVP